MLLLLWIFWFFLSDLSSGNGGIGLCINNILPSVIPLLRFWFSVRVCIWFRSLYLSHQWLLSPTLTCVVSGALMELAPLSCFLLRLCSVALFLRLWKFFLSFHALAVSLVLWFGGTFTLLLIRRSKVSLFLFEFLLNSGSIPVCHTKRGDV